MLTLEIYTSVFEVFVFFDRMHIPAPMILSGVIEKCITSKPIKLKSHGEETRLLYSQVLYGVPVVEPLLSVHEIFDSVSNR